MFSSITLTNFDISYQVFIIFLNFDTINQIKKTSLYGILNIIIFGITISQTGCTNLQYIILVLCLNFCSCYLIDITTDFQFFPSTFTFISSCLSSFLQCSTGSPLNSMIFLFSLFLSLPHFPLPVAPQRINYENFKVIIYIILTVVCNIIAIEYGFLYNVLSLVSDAMMSMCNCVTMIGEIIADIASYLPPTKRFPYGYKRGIIICDFTVTILLIYVTFDLISTAISTIISNDFYSVSTNELKSASNISSSSIFLSSPSLFSSFFHLFSMPHKNSMSSLNHSNSLIQSFSAAELENSTHISIGNENTSFSNGSGSPMALFYVALIGLFNNTFGVFFLGTIQIRTCTVSDDGNSMSVFSDFISSVSVVLCSIFSVFFKINYLDPFISIFISLMILVLSVSRMLKLLTILLQKIPDNLNQNNFFASFDANSEDLPQYNAWSLDETTKIVSFKLPKMKPEASQVIRGKISNFAQNNQNLIITYEV